MKLDPQAAPEEGSDEDAPAVATDSGGDGNLGAPRSIGKDEAFHVLQNARRRAVLRFLLDRPDQEEFRMRNLAEAVGAWEHDTTVRQLSSDERQRVYIALYQSHLPKLDEYGIIRYNQSRGIVEPAPMLAVFEEFLTAGLDADSDQLTVEDTEDADDADDADPTASPGADSTRDGFTETLSTLFDR